MAIASLEELLLDYEDFLRYNNLPRWDKNSPQALDVRNRYKSDRSDQSDRSDGSDGSDCYGFRTVSAEVAANTMICLINQAIYLLKKQLERLEQDFISKGGFTERLYRTRKNYRDNRMR